MSEDLSRILSKESSELKMGNSPENVRILGNCRILDERGNRNA
jgi:hypothetical protein